jgi:type IV pilus assembly protein PilE
LNKSLTITKGSGFTLIELLVVVAILGVLAAIGITSYSGYVSSTKKKSTENIMRQVSLAQTEYYSENSIYNTGAGGSSCNPTIATSEAIENELLGGAKSIIDPNANPKKATAGYLICVADDASNYKIYAVDEDDPSNGCNITLTADGSLRRDPTKC